MKLFKRVIAVLVVAALITGSGYFGLQYIKRSNAKTAIVIPVSSITEEVYSGTTSLNGNITTNVSQIITASNDIVVEDIFVSQGQEVRKGDRLVSFDTTLVQMELEIARLKRTKLEQDLETAERRLYSLQHGGPVEESDSSGTADNLSQMSSTGHSIRTGLFGSSILAMASPLFAAAELIDVPDDFSDNTNTGSQDLLTSDELTSEPNRIPSESGIINGDVYNDTTTDTSVENEDLISGGSDGQVINPNPTQGAPTPTPALIDPLSSDGLTDGQVTFYQTLDYYSEPYTGTGTEQDPFVFLCSSSLGYVNVMGSFFNRMAGYSEDGGTVLYQGGYWYVLEFHKNDTIEDPEDRKASATGYYYVNGSLLANAVNPFVEAEMSVADALQYTIEEDVPEEDPVDPGYDSGGSSSNQASLSRADAIKIQEQRIQTLNLDIKESDITIGKLEKKVAMTEVVARIDGIVAEVGDVMTGATNNAETLLNIKSKEGFYLTGTVDELMRDKLQTGTILQCNSYYVGSFEATVLEVSDYPVQSSDDYWGYGESNPNVSNYQFTAEIADQTLQFGDYDWITATPEEQVEGDALVIAKQFVRSESGNYYVYKESSGALVKQQLKVGDIVNGGYAIQILGGLSEEDYIAFPYGDAAAEGTQTQQGTIDDLYDM